MGWVHEHVILPLSDWATGQHIYRDMWFLRQSEQWSEQQMLDFRCEKLRAIVNIAVEHVPYYRNLGLKYDSIRSFDDLRKLPIISKQVIRSRGLADFVSDYYPESCRLSMRSSGSTGEPFSYYTSPEATSINTAAKLLTWYKAGYRLGNRYMNIKRSARETFAKRAQDWVNRSSYVSFYSLDDARLNEILQQIEREKPLFLRSYPAPLSLLAHYKIQHPVFSHSPKRIFTTGSNLTDATRKEVELAFGCDIIDSYSCEGTMNNYETPLHDGYHQTLPYGVMEVLDDNGNPVIDGIGRVISTDFWNQAQPFIRYDTLDLVEMKDGVVHRIIGHDCETIIDVHGKRLTVYTLDEYLSRCDDEGHDLVSAFQVVYRKDKSITFRLVVTPFFTEKKEQEITRYWTRELGCPVNVEKVHKIPLMHNNKRLVTITE